MTNFFFSKIVSLTPVEIWWCITKYFFPLFFLFFGSKWNSKFNQTQKHTRSIIKKASSIISTTKSIFSSTNCSLLPFLWSRPRHRAWFMIQCWKIPIYFFLLRLVAHHFELKIEKGVDTKNFFFFSKIFTKTQNFGKVSKIFEKKI